MDLNDRALRHVSVGAWQVPLNGIPREDGFVLLPLLLNYGHPFCLATGIEDLKRPFGQHRRWLPL